MRQNCPFCNSSDLIFKKKAGEWECVECEQRFKETDETSSGSKRSLRDPATKPKMIFFSYGHDENRELVDLFRKDLESIGHKVWIDFKEIGIWEDWRGKITQGIYQSDFAIAFLSAHSTRDPGVCKIEIAMALNRFGEIFPVILEPVDQLSIPINITAIQWIDLSQWQFIRDGKIPHIKWENWYEERLIEIISKIENDFGCHADEILCLRRLLNPPDFESQLAKHIEKFVGREWVFNAFEKWRDEKPESRVFWLVSQPGFGKTAVCVNICHNYRSSIVASWYCDKKSKELNDPFVAIKSISFQLALRWHDFRERLAKQLGLDSVTDGDISHISEYLSHLDLTTLFRRLLLEPLAGLIWRENKLVILIDGLDEAAQKIKENPLVELISTHFLDLPNWISFFLTSRPDPYIMQKLAGFKPYELIGSDEKSSNDIAAYCEKYLFKVSILQNESDLKRKEIIKSVVAKSKGMILYVKMLEEGLKEGTYSIEVFDDLSTYFQGLNRHYIRSFEQRFGDKFNQGARDLFCLLLASHGPLPESLAKSALKESSEDFNQVIHDIGYYVVNVGVGLEVFHLTLSEWLQSSSNNASYYIDPEEGIKKLGIVLWEDFARSKSPKYTWKKQITEWLPKYLPLLEVWNEPANMAIFGKFLVDEGKYLDACSVLLHALCQLSEEHFSYENKTCIDSVCFSLIKACVVLTDIGKFTEVSGVKNQLVKLSEPAANLSANFIDAYILRRQTKLIEANELLEAIWNDVNIILPDLSLRVAYQKAHVGHLLGNYDQALSEYQTIVTRDVSSAGELEAREYSKRQLADIMMLKGRFNDALILMKEAMAFRANDPVWDIETKRFIGHVFRFNCLHHRALEMYLQVHEESLDRKVTSIIGKSETNLAETYCWIDPEFALDYADKSIITNTLLNNFIEVGKAKAAKSIALHLLSRDNEALHLAKESEKIQEKVGYKSGILFAKGAYALGSYKNDRDQMHSALKDMERMNNETGVYRFLSWFYFRLCNTESMYSPYEFDWLDHSQVMAHIKTVTSLR